MANGRKLEPTAREIYSKWRNVEVSEIGFISMGKYIGCSPDGLIGDDGILEIKCPEDLTFCNYLLMKEEGQIIKNYIDQIQWNLWVSGRQWCDLFIYCGDEAGNKFFAKQFIYARIQRDEEHIEKFQIGVKDGIGIIETMLNKYEEIKLLDSDEEVILDKNIDNSQFQDYEEVDPNLIPF